MRRLLRRKARPPGSVAAPDGIEILALDPGDDVDLLALARTIGDELDCPVVVRRGRLDPRSLLEPGGEQVDARRLLGAIREEPTGVTALLRLAVVGVDLYRPGVDYEFGEAERPGSTALVSTHRLRKGGKLHARLAREALHELAHTVGLGHCDHAGCALSFAFDVADLDERGHHLCARCREEARRRLVRARTRRAPWTSLRRAVAVLGLLAIVVAGALLLRGNGIAQAESVGFSHEWHVGCVCLHCDECHLDPDCRSWSGLPDERACRRCHAERSGNPRLVRLEEWLREDGPAPWCRERCLAHREIPAHSPATVRRGGEACRQCHGDRCDRESLRVPQALRECCGDCHEDAELRRACASCHED